jgi:hypothetical protein
MKLLPAQSIRSSFALFFALAAGTVLCAQQTSTPARWTEARANEWYAKQAWPVGADFLPSTAVNELEMWQAETFDPVTIDRELGWAEAIGMNTMRVFLHNLLWEQDPKGFTKRIDQFLAICARHHIRPVFVLFDSCWDPHPKLGPQKPPIPGVHNSRWVQAPGAEVLADPAQYPKLEVYTRGVVSAFANDPRILAWDLWNEPDNGNDSSYAKGDPRNKNAIILGLLPQVYVWARQSHPIQPLTSGLWDGDWSTLKTMTPVARVQIEQSDILSFHNYGWPESFKAHAKMLEKFHRPLICTEYMARNLGSTFDEILPIAKKHRIGAINWGLVAGKSQTWIPWDSWQHPYDKEDPVLWQHDIFHPDGSPYREAETDLIQQLTGKNKHVE